MFTTEFGTHYQAETGIQRPAAKLDTGELSDINNRKNTAKWAGCSERHLDNLVKDGLFPAPIRLGHSPRWRRSDLLNWLESQAANSK